MVVNMDDFMKRWNDFWTCRIAGETLTFEDMERFMTRTSGKNLSNLMKGKKMEGYMEGAMDRMLTRGQKIALASVVTIIFVVIIVYIVLKNQGVIPV
jgi:hypothetical protein